MTNILSIGGNAEVLQKGCPFCGSISISRNARTHRNNRHSPDYSGELQRVYRCRKCGKTFERPVDVIPKTKISLDKCPFPSYLKFRGA